MTNIEDIAGAKPDDAFERDLAACVEKLAPVVRSMIKAGHTPNAIIAALAKMTGHTADPRFLLLYS